MNTKKISLFAICGLLVVNSFAQSPYDIEIGQWRDHFSYYFTHNVCKMEDEILVACQSALFLFDPQTKQMDKLTKVNGLSDAGISVTDYDSISKSLVITYDNANVDIVQNDVVYNIPDIKNRSIEGNKSINSIYFKDYKAYLSCGFGVVVLDLKRHEIYDTWYLGENSSPINVNCVYINDTSIFAGTKRGLLYADKNSIALASSDAWHDQNISTENYIEVDYIVPLNSRQMILGFIDEKVRANNPNQILHYLLSFDGQNIAIIDSSLYLVNLKNVNGKIAMIDYLGCSFYDSTFTQYNHYSDAWNPLPGISLDVMDVYFDDKDIWFAHRTSGLIHVPTYGKGVDDREIYFPDGPNTNSVYNLTVSPQGVVYVTPGGKDVLNNNQMIKADCYTYNGYYWDDLDYGQYEGQSLSDVLNITVDPRDETHLMMSSWWNGIIEVKDMKIVNIYDSSNTNNMIDKYPYNYRIANVQYDVDGNLLVANSLVNHGLAYLNYNNVWGNFLTSSYLNSEIMGMCVDNFFFYKLIFTSDNKIVMINNNGQMRYIDPNHGSLLQTSSINCMVQDQDGEIWIGTEKGLKVIYSLYDAMDNSSSTTSNVECNNIVYTQYNDQDTISQYLLSFENITCIMIDGANRKWIGTERGGIYVLNSSASKEIYHFTMENSPLVSNKIICMAQNYKTGEVFIGTDRGLVSYRAESMPESEVMNTLTIYPNPVRPGYNGTIAIKGFLNDTDVRITDITGRMVAHLKSLGGQAIWDGKNFQGQKVASGVYFIFASANEGNNKADGKLLIIR